MDSYKKMYYRLFNRVTDVIRELESIQTETEELFLSQNRSKPLKTENILPLRPRRRDADKGGMK